MVDNFINKLKNLWKLFKLDWQIFVIDIKIKYRNRVKTMYRRFTGR